MDFQEEWRVGEGFVQGFLLALTDSAVCRFSDVQHAGWLVGLLGQERSYGRD